MINSLVVLLTVPANLHFLILLYRDAFDSTALQTQILQFENGHYISMMMKYAILEFAFLFFTGISIIVMLILYFCKPFRWATRPAPSEEVIEVHEKKVSRWIQFFSSSSKQTFEQVREEYSKLIALTQSSHLSLSSFSLYSNKQSINPIQSNPLSRFLIIQTNNPINPLPLFSLSLFLSITARFLPATPNDRCSPSR